MVSKVTHPFIDLRDSEGQWVCGGAEWDWEWNWEWYMCGWRGACACVPVWGVRRALKAWGGGVSPAVVVDSFLPVCEDEVRELRLSICTRAVAQLVRGERFRIVLALPEDRKQLPQDEARQRLRSSRP